MTAPQCDFERFAAKIAEWNARLDAWEARARRKATGSNRNPVAFTNHDAVFVQRDDHLPMPPLGQI